MYKIFILVICAILISICTSQRVNFERPSISMRVPEDGDIDFQNETTLILSNSYVRYNLQCNAPYPIQWIFYYAEDDDGISETRKRVTTHRIAESSLNSTEMEFLSTIEILYETKAWFTPNYSCQAVQNPRIQTNVITILTDRRNVLTLTISNEPLSIKPKKTNESSCPIKLLVVGLNPQKDDAENFSPCWRCEEQINRTRIDIDFHECDTFSACNSDFQTFDHGRHCLQIVDNLEDPYHECNIQGPGTLAPKYVTCKQKGVKLIQHYFHTLPQNKSQPFSSTIHFDWNTINPKEMITMSINTTDSDNDNSKQLDLYLGMEVTINCNFSRFYFSEGYRVAYQVQLENETYWREYISKGLTQKNSPVAVPSYDEDYEYADEPGEFINEGIFQFSTPITLFSALPTTVYCIGPVWNSTEWVNKSIQLEIKTNSSEPLITTPTSRVTTLSFALGETEKTIICEAMGSPIPSIEWFIPQSNTSFPYSESSQIIGNVRKSELLLDEASFSQNGDYSCVAKNFRGTEFRNFTVSVYDSRKRVTVILATVLPLIIVVGIIVLLLCWQKILVQKAALRRLTDQEIAEFRQGNPRHEVHSNENVYVNTVNAIDALAYDLAWEIPKMNFIIDTETLLGSGAYGKVYKGRVKKLPEDSEIHVAVKTVSPNVDVLYFKALLSEIKVMAHLGEHKNIVRLIGAYTKEIRNRKVFIALELCPRGALDSFLKDNRHNFKNLVRNGKLEMDTTIGDYINDYDHSKFSTIDLIKFAYDIASGLEFLAQKKVIHGDIATRNILLSEDLRAKIGDFGLSRQFMNYSNYFKATKCPLPWRWMAPESFKDSAFSIHSDIWSYGITLWEIFTLAETPYPGRTCDQHFIEELCYSNLRPPQPPLAPFPIQNLLDQCWILEPKNRISAKSATSVCYQLIKSALPENYVVDIPVSDNVPNNQQVQRSEAVVQEQHFNSHYANIPNQVNNSDDYLTPNRF